MGKSDPRPMPKNFHCSVCKEGYAMEWARNNHQKLCLEKERNKLLKKK